MRRIRTNAVRTGLNLVAQQAFGFTDDLLGLALSFLRKALGDQLRAFGLSAESDLGLADGFVGSALGLVDEFAHWWSPVRPRDCRAACSGNTPAAERFRF